jgi:nitrite reductase/ring-hydroxylating ferredoxin subunit/uncharacterized membrane protein
MQENLAMELIEGQRWLEPTGEKVQKTVSAAFEGSGETGRKVKNFLHGTWLGHPLHPVLTDIPLGAWTAALVMDAMDEISGRREFASGADAAVAIGLAGAVGAAITGLTDWQATDGRARKIGLTHAIMNTAGAALYGASLAARRKGARSTGRGLSFLGFAIASASAWLGGALVYSEQIGVDHTLGQRYPEEFMMVMAESDLPEGEMRRVNVDGGRVLLARREGKVYAIAEVCSHLGGPLAEGELKDCTVTCPWHGSKFSLEDGRVIDGPATHPQPRLDVRIMDGQIEVRTYSERAVAK